jgi:flavin reductase (DIM6/NTAB) family NADH-FMN oxidoreductase RutF
MDRTAAIERLTVRLRDASARADWNLLERAVRELGPQVQALVERGAWSARERVALAGLRAAHDGAARAIAEAAAQLEAQLDELNDNKEGWMAYALAGELETGSTQ